MTLDLVPPSCTQANSHFSRRGYRGGPPCTSSTSPASRLVRSSRTSGSSVTMSPNTASGTSAGKNFSRFARSVSRAASACSTAAIVAKPAVSAPRSRPPAPVKRLIARTGAHPNTVLGGEQVFRLRTMHGLPMLPHPREQVAITPSRQVARIVLERAFARAVSDDVVPAVWVERTAQLGRSPSGTYVAALGTALLAKATDRRADALSIKARSGPNGYSMRGLGHSVLAPFTMEPDVGFDLLQTRRAPEQPAVLRSRSRRPKDYGGRRRSSVLERPHRVPRRRERDG